MNMPVWLHHLLELEGYSKADVTAAIIGVGRAPGQSQPRGAREKIFGGQTPYWGRGQNCLANPLQRRQTAKCLRPIGPLSHPGTGQYVGDLFGWIRNPPPLKSEYKGLKGGNMGRVN